MALLVKLGKSAGERQMIKGGDEREREREREGEDRRFSFMATLLRRKKATMLHCLVGTVALTVSVAVERVMMLLSPHITCPEMRGPPYVARCLVGPWELNLSPFLSRERRQSPN